MKEQFMNQNISILELLLRKQQQYCQDVVLEKIIIMLLFYYRSKCTTHIHAPSGNNSVSGMKWREKMKQFIAQIPTMFLFDSEEQGAREVK